MRRGGQLAVRSYPESRHVRCNEGCLLLGLRCVSMVERYERALRRLRQDFPDIEVVHEDVIE